MTMLARALLASVASMALALPAAAVTLNFTLTSLKGTDYTASWQLPQSPTLSGFYPNQFGFVDVSVLVNGSPETKQITFFRAGGVEKGGVMIGLTTAPDTALAQGLQLYTGTSAAPTFLLGTFELERFTVEGILPYQLTISEAPGGVPEPASWAMLIAGFGLVGAVRRRRVAAVTA